MEAVKITLSLLCIAICIAFCCWFLSKPEPIFLIKYCQMKDEMHFGEVVDLIGEPRAYLMNNWVLNGCGNASALWISPGASYYIIIDFDKLNKVSRKSIRQTENKGLVAQFVNILTRPSGKGT